ncbi:MAG: NIF family HAD-type phosphatase [Xenococcaceae cyanobacterium]
MTFSKSRVADVYFCTRSSIDNTTLLSRLPTEKGAIDMNNRFSRYKETTTQNSFTIKKLAVCDLNLSDIIIIDNCNIPTITTFIV